MHNRYKFSFSGYFRRINLLSWRSNVWNQELVTRNFSSYLIKELSWRHNYKFVQKPVCRAIHYGNQPARAVSTDFAESMHCREYDSELTPRQEPRRPTSHIPKRHRAINVMEVEAQLPMKLIKIADLPRVRRGRRSPGNDFARAHRSRLRVIFDETSGKN